MIKLFLDLGFQFFTIEPCLEFFAAMFVVGAFALFWEIMGVRR